MFYLHQSNQMEQLALRLCALLKQTAIRDPFICENILVQSPGMSQWLKLTIAEYLGVMANVEFPLPSSFIWSLYQKLISDLPADSAFDKQDMAWKLFTILPRYLDNPQFAALNAYLVGDDDGFKVWQLCEKIADVFDQYLMYRPDWIINWQAGVDEIKHGDVQQQPWQPILWRALVEFSAELGQPDYHRANLHQLLQQKIPWLTTHLQQLDLPPRIFIFGISALPQQQLEIFQSLSEFIDIHLMLFNPCQGYWGDIEDEKALARRAILKLNPDEQYQIVGNPLLASWGKLGRDYVEQLLLLDIDSYEDFQLSDANHLLNFIQTDIAQLSYRQSSQPLTAEKALTAQGKRRIAIDDRSLQFHACHSPLREVEVLHDQLLALFAADDQLTVKDVIVMMPDVALYSPYIAAVFGGEQQSDYQSLPFAISDKGFSVENPIAISFLQLMNIAESRFEASGLLDLLAVPAIIHAMGLVPDDIHLIRHWIDKVGIRWGIDGQHKQQLALPDDPLNTWRFGLQRLLLGYAMKTEQLVEGILPYTDVEGQSAEQLGKLVHFVELLLKYRQLFAEKASILDKCQQVMQLLEDFYAPDHHEALAINNIRSVLNELLEQYTQGHCTTEIAQRVFSDFLAQRLNEKTSSQRFLAGQINFCTLLPMRSIPFKVICLLGLNDGDYPRMTTPVGFDLMATGTARKGDRSRRLDDRYLLLEALLSARQHLYISYVGRSLQDNSPKVPSILVSELIEYCEQGFEFAQDDPCLVNHHPLQPFAAQYYTNDSQLFSFNPDWYRYLTQMSQSQSLSSSSTVPIPIITAAKPPQGELALQELLSFLLHPVKYFFNRTLQLQLGSLQAMEQDDEVFVLDGLSRYQILDQLSKTQLFKQEVLDHQTLAASGVLPYRRIGYEAYRQLAEQADGFVDQLQQVNREWLAPIEVDLSVGGFRLLGWIKQFTTEGLVFYRPATIKSKDRLSAWFYHVVAAAMGDELSTNGLGSNSASNNSTTQGFQGTRHIGLGEQIRFASLVKEEAHAILQQWLTWYQQGLQQPLPFFVNTSDAWGTTGKQQALIKAFNGSYFVNSRLGGMSGEGQDPYIRRVYQDVEQLPTQFYQLAEACFTPLNQAIIVED